jgi:hypothetical protein
VPRERLHNILLNLNRAQSAIKFFRDGTGEGITWKLKRHFRARAVVVNHNRKIHSPAAVAVASV